MNISLVYLAGRVLYRIGDFFRHWYVDGSRWFIHGFVLYLEALDRTFALRVTARHFWEPLYKDYSPVGRVLGVVFRSARVCAALAAYLLVACVFLAIYLAWLSIPVGALIYAVLRLNQPL